MNGTLLQIASSGILQLFILGMVIIQALMLAALWGKYVALKSSVDEMNKIVAQSTTHKNK